MTHVPLAQGARDHAVEAASVDALALYGGVLSERDGWLRELFAELRDRLWTGDGGACAFSYGNRHLANRFPVRRAHYDTIEISVEEHCGARGRVRDGGGTNRRDAIVAEVARRPACSALTTTHMNNDNRYFLVPIDDPCLRAQSQADERCQLAVFEHWSENAERPFDVGCWFDATGAVAGLAILGERKPAEDFVVLSEGKGARWAAEGLMKIVSDTQEALGVKRPLPTRAGECPGWPKLREQLALPVCYRDLVRALVAVDAAATWFMATLDVAGGTKPWR